jgi:hypothetical protein
VHFAFRETPPLHLLSYWSVRSDMGTANSHVYIDNLWMATMRFPIDPSVSEEDLRNALVRLQVKINEFLTHVEDCR